MPIYLDHHATTPCDEAVVEAMLPWFRTHFGNAGSTQHTFGLRARAACDLAREQVAALIGAEPDEIVFTSGATESDNLAILGFADAQARPGHLITCGTEHKAVLDPMHRLRQADWDLTVLEPDPDGRLPAERVAEALRDDTRLVSIMTANNETGVLHDLDGIAAVVADHGAFLHTDAVQSLGRVPFDVRRTPVDMLSLSAHKMYGPKGVGALWIRRRGRPVPLTARQIGGGQERGLRSGTLPVPMLVGLGRAADLARADAEGEVPTRLAGLRDRLLEGLREVGGVHVHGSLVHRLPHNLSVSFEGVTSSPLITALRAEVAVSSGSACSTGRAKASHVLGAMAVPEDLARGVIRYGLGRDTTPAQIEAAIEATTRHVRALRASDPRRNAP